VSDRQDGDTAEDVDAGDPTSGDRKTAVSLPDVQDGVLGSFTCDNDTPPSTAVVSRVRKDGTRLTADSATPVDATAGSVHGEAVTAMVPGDGNEGSVRAGARAVDAADCRQMCRTSEKANPAKSHMR